MRKLLFAAAVLGTSLAALPAAHASEGWHDWNWRHHREWREHAAAPHSHSYCHWGWYHRHRVRLCE